MIKFSRKRPGAALMRKNSRRLSAGAVVLGAVLALGTPASPVNALGSADADYNNPSNPVEHTDYAYTNEEILSVGHSFFGTTTKGIAKAVEYVFKNSGRPTGYIIGQEAAGAFIGGLRYGEGTLYLKNGARRKVYWQGPSVGFDAGGNGSRTLVLVYHIGKTSDIFDRFVGIEGSAYLIGGVGVNFQSNRKLKLAPIRTGLGARLGANIGYLKYTARPTWNPF